MEGIEVDRDVYYSVRWICPKCSRFIADSAVESRTVIDPDSYYGVSDEMWGECKKCGRVDEPRCIQTQAHPILGRGNV